MLADVERRKKPRSTYNNRHFPDILELLWTPADGELAEGTRFELAIGFDTYNGLANRRLQPLGHPSTEEWKFTRRMQKLFYRSSPNLSNACPKLTPKSRTLRVPGLKKTRCSANFKQIPPIIGSRRTRRGTMNLSKRSVEMLLDLVEIKLSYMDISDREDARDMQVLERARSELQSLDREPETVAAFARPIRRPGRPRTAA
jgi:hypothetical protein